MIPSLILLDAAPSLGSAASSLIWGGAILLAAIIVAILVFKLLKRSLKMALRVLVLVMILVIAALTTAGVFVYRMFNAPKIEKPAATQRQK